MTITLSDDLTYQSNYVFFNAGVDLVLPNKRKGPNPAPPTTGMALESDFWPEVSGRGAPAPQLRRALGEELARWCAPDHDRTD